MIDILSNPYWTTSGRWYKAQQHSAEEVSQQPESNSKQADISLADTQNLIDPFILLCAHILAGKGDSRLVH